MAERTYTHEQYNAIVSHNLTIRAQLEDAMKSRDAAIRQCQKQRGMIEALVTLLSQVGWKVGANGSVARLMLDTEIVPADRPGTAFVTISASSTGRRWNVHEREGGEEYAVSQAHFDYIGPRARVE